MKKILVALLALIMILALCSCGANNANTNEPENAAEEVPAETEETVATEETVEETKTEIKLGEKIVTDSYELTLYDAQVGTWHKNLETGSWDSKWSGDPMVQVYVLIKNLEKSEVKLNKAYKCVADYDDGYIYEPDGLEKYHIFGGSSFTSSTTPLSPLKEYDIMCEIKVPEEVMTNKSAPLAVILTLWDGAEYTYSFTEDNYNR